MIRDLLEQLLVAALIEHAAREVARNPLPATLTPERRHAYSCNVFNGGMCSCY